eukprot:TRINITY_DN2157_c0_g1_i1.p1 TRINITY_DN2157_c0_g1~~TRINITY_DN2157_c0_g1_i1.p1  ORF type:complete len:1133 (-),score=450.35 TRINITY_DN2157_c0_g1_i1:58-3456(-)
MAAAGQAAMAYTTSGIQAVSSNIWGPKTLVDLVRGIRSHKKDESQYIAACMQEIKEEIKQEDHNTKSVAVQKLTYLQMLGYDIRWSAFQIILVMSQPNFTERRHAYLAASQSFTDDTKEVVLCTSLLKRALQTGNQFESGLAINCLANICTPDLARDLADDIVKALNSANSYLRKKAVLVLYKIFLKWQGALRPAFPRLKERLEDSDPSVVSAAVNVICELSRRNPKNYLTLAPTLFKVLQTSGNNWMLIKIIKLFASLCTAEKRLGRRLIEPLTNIINTTTAMSLLYECIQTCIIGMPNKIPLMKLCIQKLRVFVEDPDQNLKYLGLLALNNIMKVHPKAVAEHKELVIKCLDDADETIRLRALDLLAGMINSKNAQDIVQKLVEQMSKTESNFYRDELISKIIEMCSLKMYKYISDFDWYITTLVDLVQAGAGYGSRYGKLLSSQFMDVLIRVESVRDFGINAMLKLLKESILFSNGPGGNNSIQEVLYAAAWLIGEFPSALCLAEIPAAAQSGAQIFFENKKPLLGGIFIESLHTLLHPRVFSLPGHIQAVFMQSVLKLFTFALRSSHPKDNGVLEQLINDLILKQLAKFQQSPHIEVQERACFAYQLISIYSELKATVISTAMAASNPAPTPAPAATPAPAPVPVETTSPNPPEEDGTTSTEQKQENQVSEAPVDPTEENSTPAPAPAPAATPAPAPVNEVPSAEVIQNAQAALISFAASIIEILSMPLNPVGPTAQGKVPIPEGIDLTKRINEPEEPEYDSSDDEGTVTKREDVPWWRQPADPSPSSAQSYMGANNLPWTQTNLSSPSSRESSSGAESRPRRHRASEDPYILSAGQTRSPSELRRELAGEREGGNGDDLPPVKDISDLGISGELKKLGRGDRRREGERSRPKKRPVVRSGFEYHPGSVKEDKDAGKESNGSSGNNNPASPNAAGNVFEDMDLNKPLEEHEMLRQPSWPVRSNSNNNEKSNNEDKKKEGQKGDRKDRGGDRDSRRRHRSSRDKDGERRSGGERRERREGGDGEKEKKDIKSPTSTSPVAGTGGEEGKKEGGERRRGRREEGGEREGRRSDKREGERRSGGEKRERREGGDREGKGSRGGRDRKEGGERKEGEKKEGGERNVGKEGLVF